MIPAVFSSLPLTLTLTLSLSVILPAAVRAQTPAEKGIVLRNLGDTRHVFFGAAANTTFLFVDENYTRVISTQYSIFTPENEMKWEFIEPEPDVFDFTAADEIVAFAESINASMRGHNFEWGNQLPPWVNDSLTATELDRALKNHITKVLEHYAGKLFAMDVINEMISDNANETFKDNIWTQKFGEDAVPRALFYAREVDKTTKLYMNDYGAETINTKSDTLFSVVQGFITDGVPIDGIGFQCHFTLGQVPPDIQQNLQRFVDLGLEVAITELDINMNGSPNETALRQQAEDFWTVASACLAVDGCVSVTTWGVSDDHSWLAPLGHPLPFDEEKNPKPAFFALADAFEGKAVNGRSTVVT